MRIGVMRTASTPGEVPPTCITSIENGVERCDAPRNARHIGSRRRDIISFNAGCAAPTPVSSSPAVASVSRGLLSGRDLPGRPLLVRTYTPVTGLVVGVSGCALCLVSWPPGSRPPASCPQPTSTSNPNPFCFLCAGCPVSAAWQYQVVSQDDVCGLPRGQVLAASAVSHVPAARDRFRQEPAPEPSLYCVSSGQTPAAAREAELRSQGHIKATGE
jgi:hypothetical protein